MVKNLERRDWDDERQPSCIWGLVHALDYHNWHPNMRKKIKQRIYQHPTNVKSISSPQLKTYYPDNDEAHKLLSENESPYIARIRALMADETYRENKERRSNKGSSPKPNLQRTYSVHHLQSLDDHWKASQPFDHTTREVLDIFKVDKELFRKHLQKNDKEKLTKSHSFPRRKLKPANLENKQRENWVNKFQNVNDEEKCACVDGSLVVKYTHLLNVSKSLKLRSEYTSEPTQLRRIQSLSNLDFYYPSQDSDSILSTVNNDHILYRLEEKNEKCNNSLCSDEKLDRSENEMTWQSVEDGRAEKKLVDFDVFVELYDVCKLVDLEADKRWMNLQLDMESIALELEGIKFTQLLQEIIYF
ncbi:phosphatidylinositolN-acetyglucosaminlytransferase subunit P-related [Striga asiatica]|uniref:PhosphatidylinositolN-acetyglucosaminlytransferase subunit P-related n=1 Tax=Striga asiatica TaxID=4170 RepID=A0A5A7PSL6_STRAF|nr:phosphatidylinositolN-acetyglucosaminlytransferase subunit P-related [Striga asiatica]